MAAVAHVVDESCADDPGHVLVHLREPRSDVTLGLKSVATDVHPFEIVAGFTAPSDWWAFGIRARGRAHHLDEPSRVTEGIATTFLVDRDGHEASVLRAGEVVTPLPGPAAGTIPDLCRRAIGRATPEPEVSSAHLWTTRWLDAVLTEWGRPERRRVLSKSFGAVVALHPAVEGAPTTDISDLATRAARHAEQWTWAALRQAPEPLALPDGPLPGHIARWMDDGFFARWCLGAYPALSGLSIDLLELLDEPVGRALLEALVAVLGPEAPR